MQTDLRNPRWRIKNRKYLYHSLYTIYSGTIYSIGYISCIQGLAIQSGYCQKGIDLLENVQQRFTKSISKLHYLPYTARLSSLNIPTLSCRRTHIDFCTVYCILHYHTCLDPSCYFSFRTESVTRGHPFTLLKPPVRLDSSKFSLFSRIIDLWNSLPFTVVSAGSFSAFKARLKLLLF